MLRRSVFDVEDFSNSGSSDLARWRDGIAAPLLLTGWMLFQSIGFLTGHVSRSTRFVSSPWTTPLIVIAIAVGLHSERFWATSRKLADYVWLPRVITGLLVIAAVVCSYFGISRV